MQSPGLTEILQFVLQAYSIADKGSNFELYWKGEPNEYLSSREKVCPLHPQHLAGVEDVCISVRMADLLRGSGSLSVRRAHSDRMTCRNPQPTRQWKPRSYPYTRKRFTDTYFSVSLVNSNPLFLTMIRIELWYIWVKCELKGGIIFLSHFSWTQVAIERGNKALILSHSGII